MADIDFRVFDCDNHYYEAKDAFTRHIEPEFAKRGHAVGRDQRSRASARRAAGSTASSRIRRGTRFPSPVRSTSISGAATRRAPTLQSSSASLTGWRIIPSTKTGTPGWRSWMRTA